MPRALVLVVAFAAGCGWSSDLPFRKQLPVRMSLPLVTADIAAAIRLHIAELEIVAGPAGTATLEGTTEVRVGTEADLALDWRAATLTMGTKGIELSEPAVPRSPPTHQLHHRLKLALPADVPIDAVLMMGSAKAADRTARTRLTIDNGEAWLDRSQGAAELVVTNGEAMVRDHQGPAIARVSNGNAFVGLAKAKGDVTVESTVGNATARVPADAGFAVRASTDTGSLSSDVPLETSKSLLGASASGKLGDGAHQLVLKTKTGNVVLTLVR